MSMWLLYFIFRVIVGLLFLLHGAQKFGVFGGDVVAFELYFGLLVPLNSLLEQYRIINTMGALVGAVEMLVAYFMKHASRMDPLTNQGEPALLFLATFLVLMTQDMNAGD